VLVLKFKAEHLFTFVMPHSQPLLAATATPCRLLHLNSVPFGA
jgi:hypothetical protein